jgi:hypothetical protein
MDELEIERLGGLGGFGGGLTPRVRSVGKVSLDALSDQDRGVVSKLFAAGGAPPKAGSPDEFRYRLTRTTDQGTQTIEAPAHAIPAAVEQSVRDELI